ncbi:hypothetical protein Tsubulata_030139 [Turnera subulata]|uniref:RRM domain-containing protein n=1 Tax=Turnera subulata TaxID=218843 RepID=A0A9Q0FS54_9ROSI|nr:hypothetical protein Tsubulata_030139 [Turnera subulata]
MLSTLPCSPFTPSPSTVPSRPPLPCSPLSPGLPIRLPPIPQPHRAPAQPAHPPLTFTSLPPNSGNQPPLLPLPQPIPKNNATAVGTNPYTHTRHLPQNHMISPPTLSLTNPKPQNFSKWSRKHVQSIMDSHLATNLYIDNLPLQWTAVELHRILSKYGEVIDVFIPSKRTKSGKRFGFVRFRACHDIQRLIFSINRIKVGNGFLQALIADFAVLQVITTVFKPITWEIAALINDLSYQIIIDEFQQPPLGAVPFTTSPYFTKSLSNSPTVSKPLSSPLTSNPSAAAQSGDVTSSSSGQHTSDPFKLMPIIVNTTKPMNGHACPDVLTPQSGFVAASNNANSSCGLSTANLLVGPTNTTRTYKSPCISYSDFNTPNTHACSQKFKFVYWAFIYLPSYLF